MKFLLITLILTSDNYQRGYGDGIAASKSASAAIHMERFEDNETCEKAGKTFESLVPKIVDVDGTSQGGIRWKCIFLGKK